MHQIWGLQNKDNTNRRRMVVSVRHIGIALGVGSDTLKGIVRHHLPQQYKFSRKEINIDDSYDGCKLFTTIPGACRVLLGSKHLHRYDIIDFLVERHNYLQDQAWKAQKIRHVALDDNIPIVKNYREHIYFVFKLGEPVLLGSIRMAYEYTCISQYPWHIKNGIKNFREKHLGSIIILKMVMIPCVYGKKIIASQCFKDVIFLLTKNMIIFCW